MCLQKITVPIKLEYYDEAPTVQQQPVWAWVCGGFAIHRMIQFNLDFAKRYWAITHVNSGHTVMPYGYHKLAALRIFAAVQDVEVDGLRFGDMTHAQALAHQAALRPQVKSILYSNRRTIGGA